MTVLLGVAHGSRDDASQQVVRDLLAAVERRRPGLRAVVSYLGNAAPTPADALAALAPDEQVVVLPLLLNAATHSKTEVAGSVQAGRLAHPRMHLHYGRPFGAHPAVVDVLEQRLVEAGAADLPVIVVAGGSVDPDANATVAATARLLWEGRNHPTVDYAFVSATGPTLPEALARVSGPVAVARLFLGPGYLPGRVAAMAGAAVVTEVLGAADPLVDLVLERYDEALAGHVAMNCDACLFRTPFGGRESYVGMPQAPRES
jgi:sirohydrochlorin cobaltochelatase